MTFLIKMYRKESKFSSSSSGASSPAVLHWGHLWVRQCHGRHAGQRRHLSNHGRARAEHRSCAEHPESHALLRHVWLLRRVCLPRECRWSSGSAEWTRVFTDALPPPQVGLPAKSGVSGGVLLVVPNVMGMMCWSPPLDRIGNSVRGIHFCQVIDHHGFFVESRRVPSVNSWSK